MTPLSCRPALIAGALAAILVQPALAQPGDGCRTPFVWREAFPGDHVCVVPRTRSQAAADNAVADVRVNPFNHDYGPDTCRYGFVWRDARPGDHVCVTPRIRAEAAHDNAEAANRRAARGEALPIERELPANQTSGDAQASPIDPLS